MTDDDTRQRIEAKVAQVLSERELVINRGSNAGVELGMRFAVLRPRGEEIKDPDTGEILDSVEFAKTFVKIVQVKPRLAVGRTFRTIKGRQTVTSFANMFNSTPDRTETLRIQPGESVLDLQPKDSLVKIGDPTVQVTGRYFPGMTDDD